MAEAILVINAGSSSLKFSLYALAGAAVRATLSGNLEELHAKPRFQAKDATGRAAGTRTWDTPLGHDGAIDFLFDWLRANASDEALIGVGHRVVHGGTGERGGDHHPHGARCRKLSD